MIANYNFLDQYYNGNGNWRAVNNIGNTLQGSAAINFIYDKVPSNANFNDPQLYGQVDATETLWNGISCPDPELNQAYFNGDGAGILQ